MKKFWSGLLIVCLLLVFSGCSSSNETDDLTMDKFIEAFNNSGEDISSGMSSDEKDFVDKEKKPMYQMIGAKDGVIFDIGKDVVKLYEYESNAKIKKAVKSFDPLMEDWPIRGKFILETHNEKAIEIFNNVK
ncbi:hypothetical protein NST04_33465 [Paenibacillus sp. FSL H7-0756]|uniref:hypothetical protein n=1 Tax=Paenibacillus sp. FSL H7-0756 TaxID=2954738 RepID=UPI0030F75BDA